MSDHPAMIEGPPEGFNADDALAMDVALGALGREELRAAERRMRSDPAFRALVEGWQQTLSPLVDDVSAVAPPASVWEAIESEITPAARPVVAPAARSAWLTLGFWRGLAVGGVAGAALALAPVLLPGGPAAPPVLVATLAGTDGVPLVAATYDPARGSVIFAPATQRHDTGKSPELWVIEGKNPPRSLGVIDIGNPNAHLDARLKGLKPGSTLAISIEPLGGSPTGLPTGPVVATGTLSAV